MAECTCIVAGNDEAIVWGTAKGNCQAVLRGHDASMRWAELISNGRELLTASADGMIKRWDLHTGTCKQTSPGMCPELITIYVVAKSYREVLVEQTLCLLSRVLVGTAQEAWRGLSPSREPSESWCSPHGC